MDRLIPKKEVRRLVGFSPAEIARKERKLAFPQRVRIGYRVFWSEVEILDWIEKQKASRKPLKVTPTAP